MCSVQRDIPVEPGIPLVSIYRKYKKKQNYSKSASHQLFLTPPPPAYPNYFSSASFGPLPQSSLTRHIRTILGRSDSRPPRRSREIHPQCPPTNILPPQLLHRALRILDFLEIRMCKSSRLARPSINRNPNINHIFDLAEEIVEVAV